MKRVLVFVCLLVLVSVPAAAAHTSSGRGPLVVHLSKFGEDLHSVNMALKVGTAVAARGQEVILFLDLEGVRLADRRQPQNLSWGGAKTIGELYNGFIAAGGSVMACPHCSKSTGLTRKDLRKGATLATTDTLAELFVHSSRILDY